MKHETNLDNAVRTTAWTAWCASRDACSTYAAAADDYYYVVRNAYDAYAANHALWDAAYDAYHAAHAVADEYNVYDIIDFISIKKQLHSV